VNTAKAKPNDTDNFITTSDRELAKPAFSAPVVLYMIVVDKALSIAILTSFGRYNFRLPLRFAWEMSARTQVIDIFASINELEHPIPAEITALTRITGDMVADHRIDPAEVSAFIADVDVVIARNAALDRIGLALLAGL
jgi:DNA polymerase-3 subunit epsilon